MAEHRFSKREYAISCMFTLLFSMLLSASYFDISTCPYNSRGGSATNEALAVAPQSIFDPQMRLVPCHLLDLVVWTYVFMLAFFLHYKWRMYRAQGYHWFFLDYCYFHNMCLCALIVHILVKVHVGWTLGGDSWLPFFVSFDVLPVATAIGSLTSAKLSFATFSFFVIMSGSYGAILGAILIWRNALMYHSFDKMTSCYLHLSPAVVQGILLHSALASVRLRPRSTLRDTLHKYASFGNLYLMHFIMFCAWQFLYHVVHEIRLWRRKSKYAAACALRKCQGRVADAPMAESPVAGQSPVVPDADFLADPQGEMHRCMVARTTSYTYMMENPPLGKSGLLYRTVVLLGTSRLATTFMFSVVQWIIHSVFFVMGFVPIYSSLIVYDSSTPLMAYNMFFALLCIYNAAAMNKSWIRKLTEKGTCVEALQKEVEALRKEVVQLRKRE